MLRKVVHILENLSLTNEDGNNTPEESDREAEASTIGDLTGFSLSSYPVLTSQHPVSLLG